MRLLPLLSLAAVSCGSSWMEETEDGLRHLIGADTSHGRSGAVVGRVDVQSGETGLLFTADPAGDRRAVFLRVVGPGGDVLFDVDEEWDSGRLKTGARYATSVNSLNWPVIPTDAPLQEGRYKFEVGIVDDELTYTSGVDVDLDVALKQDGELSGGELDVVVVYAGAADADTELKRAMSEAFAVWSDLYAQVGIDVVLSESSSPGIDGLSAPGLGSEAEYLELSGQASLGQIMVVVVDELAGADGIYGIAGGIPGPLVASERSVVAVSAITNSGPDLVFSEDEERLLGETLAHETLHYLGLFHPVEPEWDQWDALDDTIECGSQVACVSQLGENLMFPYPICGPTGCTPQWELTGQQGGAANRYVGVR